MWLRTRNTSIAFDQTFHVSPLPFHYIFELFYKLGISPVHISKEYTASLESLIFCDSNLSILLELVPLLDSTYPV
jgi:hypothetical protein